MPTQVKKMVGQAIIRNAKGGNDCFLGGSTVTVTNGFELFKETQLTLIGYGEVWAVCEAGKTTTLHVIVL